MGFLKKALPVIGAVAGSIFGGPLGGELGASLGKAVAGSKSKPIQAQAAPLAASRNDALERAAAADALARRTGARGRRRTPVGGAEAATGARTSLLGRSG